MYPNALIAKKMAGKTFTMQSSSNPFIQSLLDKNTAVLGFVEASQILGFKREAAYSSRSRGDFPVRTRQIGKRLCVFTSDLIEYLENGESQAEQSVPQITRVFKVKTGRPSKREQLTAQKLGVTVKELRSMPQNSIKDGGVTA